MTNLDDIVEQKADDLRNKPIVYTTSGMEQTSVHKDLSYKTVEDIDLKLDVYYPTKQPPHTPLPAVILIHGDGPADTIKDIKDTGQYISWGQLIAASGLIAVTANHRSTENLTNVAGVANDIDDLITYVREHSKALHIAADSLCIWTCSAGSPFGLRAAFYESPLYVRCCVCYYGVTELKAFFEALYGDATVDTEPSPPIFTEGDFAEFSAIDLLQRRSGDIVPIFVARAGLDDDVLNDTLDSFVAEAIAQNAAITFMNHPEGQHGFDLLDDDARSHEIIKATLVFMREHLFL